MTSQKGQVLNPADIWGDVDVHERHEDPTLRRGTAAPVNNRGPVSQPANRSMPLDVRPKKPSIIIRMFDGVVEEFYYTMAGLSEFLAPWIAIGFLIVLASSGYAFVNLDAQTQIIGLTTWFSISQRAATVVVVMIDTLQIIGIVGWKARLSKWAVIVFGSFNVVINSYFVDRVVPQVAGHSSVMIVTAMAVAFIPMFSGILSIISLIHMYPKVVAGLAWMFGTILNTKTYANHGYQRRPVDPYALRQQGKR